MDLRLALFRLGGSLRVAFGTKIRFAVRSGQRSPARQHDSRQGSRDRARDWRGAPARPNHRARFRESRLARRRPLPGLFGRCLGPCCGNRRPGWKSGRLRRRSRPFGRSRTLIAACAEALGPPVCLINNAARFAWDTLATLDGETWEAHLDVNLRAPIFLTQAFAKALPARAAGNVINVIDQKVLRLDPEYFSYTIAKSALWTATEPWRKRWPPHQGQRHSARARAEERGPEPN